jgi:hypothetical protein
LRDLPPGLAALLLSRGLDDLIHDNVGRFGLEQKRTVYKRGNVSFKGDLAKTHLIGSPDNNWFRHLIQIFLRAIKK